MQVARTYHMYVRWPFTTAQEGVERRRRHCAWLSTVTFLVGLLPALVESFLLQSPSISGPPTRIRSDRHFPDRDDSSLAFRLHAFKTQHPSPGKRTATITSSSNSAASSSTTTPAQRVQHAIEAEDILQCALDELPHLKAPHLSSAILRMGKRLVQPVHRERRWQLLNMLEGGFKQVLQETLRLLQDPKAHSRHIVDVMLGLALLEYPVHEETERDIQGAIYELYYTTLGEQNRFQDLARGEVSSLSWSWEKLMCQSNGQAPVPLPLAFQETVDNLPFRVLIGALSDNNKNEGKQEEKEGLLNLQALIDEVDLRHDHITLGSKRIVESRLTAWQGPKPFYYSGKCMSPQPMTPRIAAIRDRIQALTGTYYDCVLINLYQDGKTGMRYHIDPDQGVYWSTNTVVVSIGDTREFCLREILPEEKNGAGGEVSSSGGKSKQGARPQQQREHHRFFVSQADAAEMNRDCQERYQHCIKVCEHQEDAGPRISLVYKQSLELALDAGKA